MAACDDDGSARMTVNGKRVRAARYSWEIHRGPIPEGLLVCHTRDNPSCVNPRHLFLGTSRDNTQDALRKGRLAHRKGFEGFVRGVNADKILFRGKPKGHKVLERRKQRRNSVFQNQIYLDRQP